MEITARQESRLWERTGIGSVILILGFVYSLLFRGIPINTTQFVILLLAVSLLFRKERVFLIYHPGTFRALIPLYLFLIYATIGVLLTSAENIAVFANMLLTVFQIGLGAYLIAVFFFGDDFELDQLLFTFLIIFAVQGFFILLSFLVPAYRELMFTLLPVSGNVGEDMQLSMYRVRGLTQGTGAIYAAHLSLGLLIAAYFFANLKLGRRDKIVIFGCLPLIITGILFTGRTGLVMIPFAILFYYTSLWQNGTLSPRKFFPVLWVVAGLVAAYFLMEEIYLLSGGDPYLFRLWKSWAFGDFINFFEGRDKQLHTLKILKSHLMIPQHDAVLLLGDPRSWSAALSDIGYVKYLFAGGVLGALLNYAGHICIYLQLILLNPHKGRKLLFLFLLIWMLILEYKEASFNNYLFTSSVMLMLFVSMRSYVK